MLHVLHELEFSRGLDLRNLELPEVSILALSVSVLNLLVEA